MSRNSNNNSSILPTAVSAAAVTATAIAIVRRMTRPRHQPVHENHFQENEKESFEKKKGCIYLDYNGTTPIHPKVTEAMLPFFTDHFGNPSSAHAYGTVPREAIERARRSILSLLFSPGDVNVNKDPSSIIFTGCGTEADNLAIYLALQSSPSPVSAARKHVVTSNVEHPAVEAYLKVLEAKGEIDVTYVPVNQEGITPASDLLSAIQPNTILVTLMLANNESGALQPVKEVAAECRKRNILFHTDAAQAVGKVSTYLNDDEEDGLGSDGIDMITIVGHKLGAPKGVAALYVRPKCLNVNGRSVPKDCGYGSSGALLLGGGQEGGRRAGTENVPYIVAMGQAADLLLEMDEMNIPQWRKNALHMEAMRSRLLHNLMEGLGHAAVRANGPKDAKKRLPNTLSVGLKHVSSGELLERIQMDVACSAGSACHASGGKLSSVLVAMKVPVEFARGTLRLSVGPTTTVEDVDAAAGIIVKEAKRQLSSMDGIMQ